MVHGPRRPRRAGKTAGVLRGALNQVGQSDPHTALPRSKPPNTIGVVLAPERVRDVLLTTEPRGLLWLAATHYFEHALDPAPLTADDIFDALRPQEELQRLWSLLPRVPPVERTREELPRLLELPGWETLAHEVVLELLPKAPWLGEADTTTPPLSLTVRRSIDRLNDLRALDFRKVWSEFVALAERWEPFRPRGTYTPADYVAWFYAFEMRRLELTVALAAHTARASAAACDLLTGSRSGRQDRRFCAASILTRCPAELAIEPLLALLRTHPWHDLRWLGVEALSRIGTDNVVRRAADCYRASKEVGLLVAIGQVRRPDAERTLIQLLGEACDVGERVDVIEALTGMFPTEGFDEMLDVVLSTEYVHHQGDAGIALEGVLNAADVAGYRGPRVPAARALLRVLDPPTPLRMGVDLN
ncbi:MAG: hypothetical protein AMXMBFR56_79870 [Polyangiaceae bacterium]